MTIATAADAAEWAQVVTAAASLCVALLAFTIAFRQWRSQERQSREEPAREAVDRFFSEPLAETRFALWDLLNECAQAAGGAQGGRFDLLRAEFGVGPASANMPTRYELGIRWATAPPSSKAAEELRAEFEHSSAIIGATFDAIIKAAEGSADAAGHVKRRMGRLLVWWMLYWPGAFDHSRNLILKDFITTLDICSCPPDDRSCAAYTDLFWRAPLWDRAQWEGAIANYDSIQETMFPADPRSRAHGQAPATVTHAHA
ncbi:MAG: hypothetical protein U0R70_11170 [Solirubrobacteraceae bacterium]